MHPEIAKEYGNLKVNKKTNLEMTDKLMLRAKLSL